MIIYLWGKDAYRRGAKAKTIIEEYKKRHSVFSLQSFDFEEDGAWDNFKNTINAVTLFDNFKFLILKNLFPIDPDVEKESKKILEKAHTDKETILLITSDDEPTKNLAFILEKPTIVQEFSELSGVQFENFIKIESTKAGFRLTSEVLRQLYTSYQGNNWGVVSAIRSLAAGQQKLITEKPKVSANIFPEAMGILKASSFKTALPIVEKLLIREDAAYVFNMLSAVCPANSKKIFADYDAAVKSGKLDYETAITDFVVR